MSAQSPPPSSMPPPTLKRPRQSAAGGAASASAPSAAGAGGQIAGAPAPRAKRRKPEAYRAEGSGSVGPELGKGGAGKDEVVEGEVKTKIDFNDLPVETLYRYLEYHDLLPRWEPSPWSEEPVMPPSHLYASQPLPYPPYATSLGFGVGPGMGSISGPAGHHLYNIHGAPTHPGLNGGVDTPPFPGEEYPGQREGAREDDAEARGQGEVQRGREGEDVVMAEEAPVPVPAGEATREGAGEGEAVGGESRAEGDRPADAPVNPSTADPSTGEDPSAPLDPSAPAPDSPSANRSPSPPPPLPPTTRSKTAPSRRPPTPPPPSPPAPAKRSLITLSDVHAARTVFAEKANAHWMRGLGGGQNKESETIVHFLYKMKVGPNRLLRVYNPLLPVPPPW
ncbi:hypothetical protein IAT38_004016 [Cryptococcus sp. DSM 104549]